MLRTLPFLVLLSIGCGTAARGPDAEPPQAPPAAPAPSSPDPTPAPSAAPVPQAQPANGCQPQTFVTGSPGLAVQYRELALDGAALAFVEAITWEASTGASGGDWLTLVDTKAKAGTTKRQLARFDGGLQAFASDASAFYVAVWGSATSTGNGTGWLARVDRASGATTTLSTGLSLSWSLAAVDDTLFFSNLTDDGHDIELRTVAKTGGAVTTAIGMGLVEHSKLLTDAGGVAWVESTGVGDTKRLVYRAGGVTTELARGRLATKALARHGDTFYFADDTGVLSVPLAGGMPTLVAAAPRVVEVFADARTVAWLQAASYAGDLAVNDDAVLMAVPATGGGAAKVAAVGFPHDLVADDAWFYWVDNQKEIKRVCRAF